MGDEKQLIFIVDDSDTALTLGKNALQGFYRVLTFNSGLRLFKALEKMIPDLIILDMEMPEMSGLDIIKQLKNNHLTDRIPVIFLTARNNDESEIEGFNLGANDFLTKPLSVPRLRKRVEVCLQLESQTRTLLHYNENLEKAVENRTRSVLELRNVVLKTMAHLVERRDHFTGGHIERTQLYIQILFKAMKEKGAYADEMAEIDEQLAVYSSQLHDVGKVGIRDSILLKPGKLDAHEIEEMRKHAEFGAQIIEQIKSESIDCDFLEYAMTYALYHHEKWNGAGYPFGLKEHNIPLLGRVMAIADVYDALISERPYKKAFSHSEAVSIIKNEGGVSFDPKLVALFNGVNLEFKKVAGS